MKIAFVTSNIHKAREAAGILQGVIEVEHIPLEIPELRSDFVGEIAALKATFAWDKLKCPVIADDTGFFIPALNGFPGTCAAFVQKTIGNQGILNLLAGYGNRCAWFETAVAYYDGNVQKVFTGRIDGTIVLPKGCQGFGYDPIFEYDGKTLAEMSDDEKNSISHRARAFVALRDWMILHQSG